MTAQTGTFTADEQQAINVITRLTKNAVTTGWTNYLHAMTQKNIAEKDAAIALDNLIGNGYVKESGEGFSFTRKRHA